MDPGSPPVPGTPACAWPSAWSKDPAIRPRPIPAREGTTSSRGAPARTLLQLLARQTQPRVRHGFESRARDRTAAVLAHAELASVDLAQRFVDLLQQRAFVGGEH